MTPVRKYNFLDSLLFCFVYKIFAVLYLRINLFALLAARKGNGAGVYAVISPEFYIFFLFILFSFHFFFTFYLPTTFTHDPRPTTHDPRPTPTTHDPHLRPTTFSYTLVFAIVAQLCSLDSIQILLNLTWV